METNDQYGNPVQIGDYITYPGRRGSSIWMRTGKVLGIEEKATDFRYEGFKNILKVAVLVRDKVTKVTLDHPERVTLVPKMYIQNNNRYSRLLSIY